MSLLIISISLQYWYNDWDKFEETGKTLDEIEADFEYLNNEYAAIIPDYIKNHLYELSLIKKKEAKESGHPIPQFSLETGTLFKISGLRDKWSDNDINKIYKVLGFLVPPGEQTQYYIFAQKDPKQEVEEIECEAIDDYDYKVKAEFDGEKVIATIDRNEFDMNVMPKEIFTTEPFKVEPYTLKDFNNREFKVEKTLSELTGNTDKEFLKKAKEVGPFSFQYLFMRLAGGEGNYYYKPVNSNRKIWMEEHGGIKIYRDNFVVRPYGDAESKSYDWLGLDARKGVNPVAISDKSGQWHANNSQIQGTVLISRIKNESILDKSSREGIIENDHFEVLSNILISIISLFEKDRAYVVSNIKKYKDIKNKNNETKEQASEIANQVLKRASQKKNRKTEQEKQTEQLAMALKIYKEEQEELISEIKLLRALATNGLMTTSMVHDLKTINSLLVTRVNGFKFAINQKDDELIFRNLNDLKNNDEFLKAWITVITTQSNRDRRQRRKKDMSKTIESAIKLLDPILVRKKVKMEFSKDGVIANKRIFETDFDSIIYNLIINSIESFEHTKCEQRKINISIECGEKFILHYLDNGQGLSDAFASNPYEIFKYGTTSKYDANGNQIGTGLGMFIVASSINEYNGTYTITKVKDGFGLDISIPL